MFDDGMSHLKLWTLIKFRAAWDTYPSSSLLIWSQNPMMYSQSSCLLDGLVALSLARERERITNQEKKQSHIS